MAKTSPDPVGITNAETIFDHNRNFWQSKDMNHWEECPLTFNYHHGSNRDVSMPICPATP